MANSDSILDSLDHIMNSAAEQPAANGTDHQQQQQTASQTLSLTSFLFGNIDDKGQLEGDVFDDEVKAQLASLSRLGLGSLLRQVTNDDNEDEDSEEDDEDEEEEQQEDELLEKSPNAVDYSDINEALEEDSHFSFNQQYDGCRLNNSIVNNNSQLDENYNDEDDDEEQQQEEEEGVDAVDGTHHVKECNGSDQDMIIEDGSLDDFGSNLSKSDHELMPPPPVPNTATPDGDNEEGCSESASNGSTKLVTPLAAMRPSKYANVDVVDLFPDFRTDKVLRFSRLFGPNKNTIPPSRSIWKHVKRKKKRRPTMEAPSDGVEEAGEELSYGENDDPFALKFASPPHIERTESEFRHATHQDCLSLSRQSGGGDAGGGSSSSDAFSRRHNNKPKPSDWRFGPAQLWYDMIDVPVQSEQCDYGFKLAQANLVKKELSTRVSGGDSKQLLGGGALSAAEIIKSEGVSNKPGAGQSGYDGDTDDDIPDDAFHMITQYNWEDDIIWNGDDLKHKIQQKRKNMAAGWVPSSYNRTAHAFSQPSSSGGGSGGGRPGVQPFPPPPPQPATTSRNKGNGTNAEDDTWYSIFPVENEDLVYSRWEDHIIWDPDNMDNIPEPPILTLDPNDENIILGIPEDVDPSTLNQEEAPVKVKIPHPHVKKSKILLGKAGVITTIEEESPPPPPKSPDKDPFNLSNDEYYSAKGMDQIIKISMGGGLLQHSTPVVELQSPFIPTYMGEKKLRQFHRPPLKHFSYGALASPTSHPVLSLVKEIKKKEKQRDNERLASGGGDVFFMRTPEDLTGKDGDLILVEYIEENPPLLSQVGMCTRIKNYYKRRACNDKGPPEYRFGETSYAHTSPFLGSMHPGQSIQTLENNMYRAPLYEHKIPLTDFLVIRTRYGYNIREAETLFTAGQECPLYEVPGPNSKSANNYVRDFLQVFIYRLFWKSHDEPRRIKMDEIKRAFPTHSESSIRKRLKPCADFKRTGVDSNWWVIKPEFRLPTEEEIRAMVSPEQCCGFGSMLAAEQRLKDAGYGDKFLSALEDDNEDDTQKLDDEVKVAPWHTTRAYIHAVKGKCLLQLTGPADPTGCGEGFSYVRIPNKPTQNKEEQEQQPKRTVTGTDADLRRLSLNNAKCLLKEYGVPDEEIKKLSRWEVIDVVRTLSTEKAKAGEEGMNKFSRGNRFSIAEHQERYKEECQRIFDLQNRVLASEEVLSTDEGSSEEEDNDSDMEEKGKYIENILANKKTSSQMTLEKEEQERRELQKMMMGDEESALEKKKLNKKEEDDNSRYGFGTPGRVLKITRTFKSADGKEYQRVEIVRKTAFIDTYVKIRTTKDENFIKEFVGQLDDVQKEEMKRERRRLQEQLRRIKRNQEKAARGIVTPPRPKKPKLKPDLKLKCGACGQVGHMRTNKACPLYTGLGGGGDNNTSLSSGMAANCNLDSMTASNMSDHGDMKKKISLDDSLDDDKTSTFDDSDQLINVDGTKIKLSSKVMKHAEELKRRSLVSKVRGGDWRGNRRRRAGTVLHCDYLKSKNKSVNRRRIDPVITLSTILEDILNQMREMPDAQPFIRPVNAKLVPDYYDLVESPMDLSTMRENLRQRKYQSREEFLSDVSQIVENSKKYNGVASTLTVTANKMLELCIIKYAEQEEKLMRLEKAINPLLDDDDQVAFDFILDNIVQMKLFTTNDSWPFMKPVSKKNVRDYYDIIQNPMDLSIVAKKVKNHKYHSRLEFLSDLQLIHQNSQAYNGPDSSYSRKAETLIEIAAESLAEYDSTLDSLEKKISLARARIEEAEAEAEGDSLASGEDDDGDAGSVSHHNLSPSGVSGEHEGYSGQEEHAGYSPDGMEGAGIQGSTKRRRTGSHFPMPDQSHRALMDDLEFSDEEDTGVPRRDETQGAAEAMMALSTTYPQLQYAQGLEDVDTNYDPSAELLGGMVGKVENRYQGADYPMDEEMFPVDQKPPQFLPPVGAVFHAPNNSYQEDVKFRQDDDIDASPAVRSDGGDYYSSTGADCLQYPHGIIAVSSSAGNSAQLYSSVVTPTDPVYADVGVSVQGTAAAATGGGDAADAGYSAIAADLDISDSDDDEDMVEVPPASPRSGEDNFLF